MRSLEQIQRHLKALKVAQTIPCSCEGEEHVNKCKIGGLLLKAVVMELEWVLGSDETKEMHEFMDVYILFGQFPTV